MIDGVKIDVNLSPEQINTVIADAIIKSVIGQKLTEAIQKKVAELSGSYNNPLERVVESEIQRVLIKVIQDKFMEQIETAVREKVTSEFVEQLFDTMWTKFRSRV